jgi:DNA polymerase-3 subunit delta
MAPSKNKGTPRAYLLWGQEELRKREALDALIQELVPAEDRDLDVEYLDATNAGMTGETILHAARDRAMFSEQRVVVVLNAGRLRGPRHQRTQETLAGGLASLPEYSTLILVAGAEEAEERRGRAPFGEKLMAALRAGGKAIQFSPLRPEELAELAMREAAAAGKNLARAAASMLATRAGPDTHRVLQETRKLAAYVGEAAGITREHVEEMVPAPPDDNIFHLLDATMSGDRAGALRILGQLRESGEPVPRILSMLGRTLRQAAQAKYLLEARVSPSAEPDGIPAEALAMLPQEGSLYRGSKEYQRKRLWGQARRITWAQLQRALDRLAVTDAGTKGWEQGVEDPDLALELFVVSLCDAVQPEAVQPRSSGRSRG